MGIQGGLGALTVWQELPPAIVATHLLLAMTILTVMAATALGMYTEVRGGTPAAERAAATRVGQRAAVAAHPVRGGGVDGRLPGESGASTACEGWPTCNGGIFPGADDQQITHMTHRYLAALLLAPLAWMALAAGASGRRFAGVCTSR